MFVRAKPQKLASGKIVYYYYLVETKRKGNKVKSEIIEYLGRKVPKKYKKYQYSKPKPIKQRKLPKKKRGRRKK